MRDRWPFGDIACRLMHYLINVTAYVTVYTLVLISVIRYKSEYNMRSGPFSNASLATDIENKNPNPEVGVY